MKHQEFTQTAEEMLLSRQFKELQDVIEAHDFPTPNLWHILGISRKETNISRFLAWLLDPQANHSFGDQFLTNILLQALQAENDRGDNLKPINVLLMDLSNVEVKAEFDFDNRRVDILIRSTDPSQGEGFLCIIENKIDAKESPQQTKDYYEKSFVKFSPDLYPHRAYIYLSPDGDPPQNENFIALSYQAVLKAVEDLESEKFVTETERFILQQFKENILRGIVMDDRTLDLAQSIYDKHQKVIDFIIQYIVKPEADGEPPHSPEWDGISWFFNTGEKAGSGYRWDDYRKFGFICAGGGKLYRDWMKQFKVGDIIYAYVSGKGYVGVATINRKAIPYREATLNDGHRLTEISLEGNYNDGDNDETCDWIALVNWELSVPKDKAVREKPITRATKSRIYDHRKAFIDQVRQGLEQ